MALKLPRVSITVDDDKGQGTQGELSALSVGFGIHQAWLLCVTLCSPLILGVQEGMSIMPGVQVASVFVFIVLAFCLTMFFAAATDQALLKYYTSKHAVAISAVLTCVGTGVIFATSFASIPGASAIGGIGCGVGFGLLTLYWGIAYSRNSTASIVLNSSIAIVIAVIISFILYHFVPRPFCGILACLLPVLELPMLWRLTPTSYAIRHENPIFNPVPIRRLSFIWRLALPMLFFGIALGSVTDIFIVQLLPIPDVVTILLMLFVGGGATVLIMVAAFAVDKNSHWDFMFRPIVPLIAFSLFFVPLLNSSFGAIAAIILMVGFLCFEALVWMFFAEMVQEFRISPIFVFGIGRGSLAVGTLIGLCLTQQEVVPWVHAALNGGVDAALVMFLLLLGMGLLPRVRDIRHLLGVREVQSETAEHASELISDAKPIADTNTPSEQPSEPAQTMTESVVPVAAPAVVAAPASQGETKPLADDSVHKPSRFRTQVDEIAARYMLSNREIEVFRLLARGHNAAYIQDKLCVSRSTAKTHIAHIYRKLDIHNQHELLAMVNEYREDED